MSILYLITHAHTHQQLDVDAAHWSLSEVGAEQARQLAQQPFWDQVDQIVLSSEPKTYLTVEPVLASRALPLTVDARFDELKRTPEWTHDYAARVAEVFANPEASIAGWEPAAHALSRFREGIAKLHQAFQAKRTVLVGHGLTFSLYRAHLLEQKTVSMDDWRNLSFAAVAQVDLDTQALIVDFEPVAGTLPRG
jgi:broad specificity phosphatase PhoE